MKKYQYIYTDLEKKLKDHTYPIDTCLPTEMELQNQYQVSRTTIRKALDLLQKKGYISKVQGRGSRVLAQSSIHFPISTLSSYQELANKYQLNSKTKVISFRKIFTDDKLSQLTGFPSHTLLWKIKRQRIVDGIPSVLDIDYIKKDTSPGLNREQAGQSLYSHIEKDHQIDFAEKIITIEPITDDDKCYLSLGNDQQVVCIRSRGYLTNGQQFQFTESRHKLDKFQFNTISKR